MAADPIVEIGQYNIREIVLTVFSTVSICLALFSTWRVIRNDRRMRLEPYFKTLWTRKSGEITHWVNEADKGLDFTKFDLKNGEEISSTNFDMLRSASIEYEKFNWDYDRSFLRKLRCLEVSLSSVRAAASNHYDQWHLTSESMATDMTLHNIGIYDHYLEHKDEEAKKKHEERIKKTSQKLKRAFEKYGLPDSASLKELKDSPAYKRDLKHLAETVLKQINAAKIHIASVQKDIDFYNFVYGTPTED